MVNILGHGFIGSHYAKMFPCVVNDRDDLVPKTKDIFYLISTVDNYSVWTDPYIDINTNLTLLIKTLENCKNSDVVFNFASSWFVYGSVPSDAKEDSYCDPRGFYSITKRTAEQLLISYCETFGIKYRIMRFSNVIGPNDKKVSNKKNALTFLIRKILRGENINLYDDGDFYRDYIHVEDLCRSVDLIIRQGELNTIYNVGTGIPVKFRSAIDYVLDKTGSTSKITEINQSDFHKIVQNKSFYMNCDKLKNLGFVPQYSIEQALDQLIQYEK